MRGADEFGSPFQRQLIRAMLDDPGLKALVGRFIAAGQLGWTDPASLWGWQVIGSDDNPSMLKLQTELRRLDHEDPARVGASVIVESDSDIRDTEYVRQSIVEWARRQTFMLGFGEAREAWNGGDHESAMRMMMGRIEEMNQIRFGNADRGWFFEELGDRQFRRQSEDRAAVSHPIGIDKIDRAMGGGLSPGELEVVMAYSGIGKTFWCVQRGFTTARRRKRCLHFVLEGGRGKTEDRYEARFADSLYRDVKTGNLNAQVMATMQREYRLLKQNLVIRGFGDLDSWRATYDDLLAELKELRSAHGWVPDMIVVDYGDLLWAGTEGESEYMRQKYAFRQLKALAERVEFRGHHGYAVCSPTQAQRPDKGADKREHVLRPRDVADCYEKVRVSDIIISLNRTEREKEHELARVYLGKYRDAEDGVCVRVRTAYTKGGFSDLTVREEPPPPPPED
tara:strand:+ start:1471 stop:2826 length:1356 start_codon:yes stop_codon:yes gene_type:complete